MVDEHPARRRLRPLRQGERLGLRFIFPNGSAHTFEKAVEIFKTEYSINELKGFVIATNDDFSEEAEQTFEVALQALLEKMPENDFVKFSEEL